MLMKQIPSRATSNVEAVRSAQKIPMDIPDFSSVALPEEVYQDIKQQNEAATSNVDTRFTNLILPSNCVFYPFKTLSSKPIGLNQQRKLSRGLSTGSMRTVVEAINTCIDRDIYQLTIGDFWFIMFWLRINSFKKSTWKIPFKCEGVQHNQDVLENKLDASTLDNVVEVTNTLIKEQQIKFTDVELAEYIATLEVSNSVRLYVATVQDLVEGEELISRIEAAQDDVLEADPVARKVESDADLYDEDDMLLKYASILSREHGVTLKERIQFLLDADLSGDASYELDQYIAKIDHGVEEKVEVICSGCRTSRTVSLSLDVFTFLPSLQ